MEGCHDVTRCVNLTNTFIELSEFCNLFPFQFQESFKEEFTFKK